MKTLVPLATGVLAFAAFAGLQNVGAQAQTTLERAPAGQTTTLPPAVPPATPIPTITPIPAGSPGGVTAPPLPGTVTPIPGATMMP